MANIKVELNHPLIDGESVTFKAPCDSTAVTGLKIYYPNITENSSTVQNKTFTFKDGHGNNLTGIGNLFTTNAYVKVILDIVNNYAYIQNADTNGYLENKFNNLGLTTNDIDLSSELSAVLPSELNTLDKVLENSSKIDMYAWECVESNNPQYEAVISQTTFSQNPPDGLASFTSSTGSVSIKYSESVSVDNGTISLVSPTTINITYTHSDTESLVLRGKYFCVTNSNLTYHNNVIYYGSPAFSINHKHSSDYQGAYDYVIYLVNAHEVNIKTTYPTYNVYSNNRNAYPDSGTINNKDYLYLGKLIDLIGNVKTEVGSYVGTGTYGPNNPCTLTFNFIPKVVIVLGGMNLSGANRNYDEIKMFIANSKEVSWYDDNVKEQFNNLNWEYKYLAIS